MTGYESKRAMAQDKLAHMTFEQRCRVSEQCLPEAPYRAMLVALHDEMLEALAQPAQEPLEYWNAVEGWVKVDEVREHFDSVGCGTIYKTAGEDRVPLYTTPPQRQPLTDEQIEDIAAKTMFPINFARAIEAAHGIKENT